MISVPVAVVSAVGGAARRGILIKGGQALEDLGRVRAVALDKTGTLTLGLPQLQRVTRADGIDEDRALALVAAVERRSEHPLAAALRRAARDRGLTVPEAEAFHALPGRGARPRVDGRALWAGGPRLMQERLGSLPAGLDALHDAGPDGDRARRGRPRCSPSSASPTSPAPRPRGLAAALRAAGIERVVMLTGDTEPVARADRRQRPASTKSTRACCPADKLELVERLERDGVPVAMVGDGVNDAPALAAARVGVAMGAAGSDVALQSADVALMSDRLDAPARGHRPRPPRAVDHARQRDRVARRQGACSSLLAPFGLVTLVVAVAADMGMSLLVTLNAMRLLRSRERSSEARTSSRGRVSRAQAASSR